MGRAFDDEDTVPADWRPGDVILGLYEVRSILGKGGMGTVYRVFHRGWEIDLAVKSPGAVALAKAGGPEFFEQESETWVGLGLHPNIVCCHYVRRLGGVPRVFAEYVDGGTLTHWIRRGRLYRGDADQTMALILDIALQMAWGLTYAHERGLVHQDVKPTNVMMSRSGAAKVADFGLSRALSGHGRARRMRGTPRYCSPEQVSQSRVTVFTDFWGWALCALEMFMGDTTWMMGTQGPDALSTYEEMGPENPRIPAMPADLVDLLHRCFQMDPQSRPESMAAVAARMKAINERVLGPERTRKTPSIPKISAESLNNHAVSLLDLGKRREADRLWHQALESHRYHLESTYNRALHQWRCGVITDVRCIRNLRRLCGRFPGSPLAAFLLAQACLERGRAVEAVEILERIGDRVFSGHRARDALAAALQLVDSSRRRIRTFGAHTSAVDALCLSWDGQLALTAAGNEDGPADVSLWDVATGTLLRLFEGHPGRVSSVCLNPDGRFAVTGGSDATVRIWGVDSGACVEVLEGHDAPVKCVDLSGDGGLAVSGCEAGTVRLWDIGTRRCRGTWQAHDGPVHAAQLTGDGSHILTAGDDGVLHVWETETREQMRTLAGHEGPVVSAQLSRDQRFALSGGEDGSIRLWNTVDMHCILTLKGHRSAVTGLRMTPDARFAVSASPVGRARLWDLCHGRCLHTFRGSAPMDLSGRAEQALLTCHDGSLALWTVMCGIYAYEAPMMLCQAAMG